MTRNLLIAVLLAALWRGPAIGIAATDDSHHRKGATRSERVALINRGVKILTDARDSAEGVDYEAATERNEIDGFTFKKMKEDGVPVNATCDDGTFIRRVSLLLTGRLPDPARTRAFLASTQSNKRAALIDEYLAGEAFNTYWAFWFQEYFQSTVSQLLAGQALYNDYFAAAVAEGKNLDQMARELMAGFGLTDQVAEANFYARANNGARFQLDFMDNAAIAVSTKLLGIPLECISCHDGAHHLEGINLYLAEKKRADLWGMAAFFSELGIRPGNRNENRIISLNITKQASRGYNATSDRGDRPPRDGGLIEPTYLFDGSGVAGDQSFLNAIIDRVTEDRQFARHFANLLWGHLFGLAMVEPIDGFDLYRIDPDYALPEGWASQVLDHALLEHMTDRMIELDFDLRDYLRYVLNSATFQMSSEWPAGNWQETNAPYYSRFLARHMTAESVYDSIVVATGAASELNYIGFNNRDTVYTAEYAHELPDVNQPRGRRQVNVLTFLDSFGRGNRYDQPRSNEGSIVQSLLLMNSPVVDGMINAAGNRISGYLDAGKTTEQIITDVYLDAFARTPTADELAKIGAELDSYDSNREKAATLLWLAINQVAFTFIY